nr:hypothetical protein C2845_PM06G21990 [Ipomoea batatas]
MHPFQGGPPIVISTRIPVLRRPSVIDGNHHRPTNLDEAPAELVVDGAVGGGVSEAAAVEEDDDRDNLGGAQRFLQLHFPPIRLLLRRRPVNPVKQTRGPIHHVKRINPVDRNRVRRHFPFQKLRQIPVERPVRPAKHVVSELEIGDENPCIERNHLLRFTGVDFVAAGHGVFRYAKNQAF